MLVRNIAKDFLCSLRCLLPAAAAYGQTPPAVLKIDTGKAVSKVSPDALRPHDRGDQLLL